MKLGDFLNTLAAKIGLQNDTNLISLLSNAELANREIDDTLATAFDTNLMSLEGAKNNAQVLNHFKPIILKAVDDKAAILASKLGLDAEIAAEKSTYKKIDLLESQLDAKIDELKGKGTGTKEVETLTRQLNELQAKMAGIMDDKAKAISDLQAKHAAEQLDMLVKFDLTNKNYANKQLPKDVNVLTAKTLLESKLRESKAIIVNENGTLKLRQAENPTMDFVDSGYKAVSFADFTDKMLAESKLLEVSGGNTPTPNTPNLPNINANGNTTNRSKFDTAFAQSLESIKTN